MKARLAALPLAAVLSLGALTACADETVVGEADEQGGEFKAALLGEPVTVQAEVQEVVSDRVFTVGENDTVVLSAGVPVDEGAEVEVTGVVRSFVLNDIEEDLGVDFDRDEEAFLVRFTRDLVVVADDVEAISP